MQRYLHRAAGLYLETLYPQFRLWLLCSNYSQYLQDERCTSTYDCPECNSSLQSCIVYARQRYFHCNSLVRDEGTRNAATQLLACPVCYRNTVHWSLIPLRLGLRSTPYSCHGHTFNTPSRPGWTVVCQSFNSIAGTSWQVIAYQWTITLTPLPVSLTTTRYVSSTLIPLWVPPTKCNPTIISLSRTIHLDAHLKYVPSPSRSTCALGFCFQPL
jgi:hypothetical protein